MKSSLFQSVRSAALPAILSLLVGFLYLGPFFVIRAKLAERGMPLVFGVESHRNDLQYLAWAREIYDGHFPPRDMFVDDPPPMSQNWLPASILAGFFALARGNVEIAYLTAIFIFAQVNFLLFYWLGMRLTSSRLWAVSFALLALLTPMALRIMNFDGTA